MSSPWTGEPMPEQPTRPIPSTQPIGPTGQAMPGFGPEGGPTPGPSAGPSPNTGGPMPGPSPTPEPPPARHRPNFSAIWVGLILILIAVVVVISTVTDSSFDWAGNAPLILGGTGGVLVVVGLLGALFARRR